MTTPIPAGWKPRLACPFCGSNCLFTEPDEVGSGGQWVSPIHVGCNDCKAEQSADTEDEAVERWNRRSSPASVAPGDAQDEHVSGETFTRGWINLKELPGGMMIGPEGRFGPIPASTSCWITTSEREVERLKADGPVLEIFTRRPAPAAGDALDAARYRWLREKAHQTAGRAPAAVLCDESDMFQRGEAGSASGFIHGKDLDAAIDAAIAAQVPQQGEA